MFLIMRLLIFSILVVLSPPPKGLGLGLPAAASSSKGSSLDGRKGGVHEAPPPAPQAVSPLSVSTLTWDLLSPAIRSSYPEKHIGQ